MNTSQLTYIILFCFLFASQNALFPWRRSDTTSPETMFSSFWTVVGHKHIGLLTLFTNPKGNECFCALRAVVLMINPIKSRQQAYYTKVWPQPEWLSVHHPPTVMPFFNLESIMNCKKLSVKTWSGLTWFVKLECVIYYSLVTQKIFHNN